MKNFFQDITQFLMDRCLEILKHDLKKLPYFKICISKFKHCEIGKLILYNKVCNTNYVVYSQFQKLISENLVIDLNKLLGNLKHFIKSRVLYFIKAQNFIIIKNLYFSSGMLSISSKNSSNLPSLSLRIC